ncbi:hypothetical protein ATC00_12585 [Sinorhizobium americanum]|nr:hypothetical protein ATC00_12585 [Sinorhizobium americanum]
MRLLCREQMPASKDARFPQFCLRFVPALQQNRLPHAPAPPVASAFLDPRHLFPVCGLVFHELKEMRR